jgi:ParB family transcriptional regulator, chromosome partitioning protein
VLTDAQRAKGINQMLLAGVSATKVAKRLAVRRDTIDAADAAATSPVAMAAGQLSLEEADAGISRSPPRFSRRRAPHCRRS